jgi:hypothetical protein
MWARAVAWSHLSAVRASAQGAPLWQFRRAAPSICGTRSKLGGPPRKDGTHSMVWAEMKLPPVLFAAEGRGQAVLVNERAFIPHSARARSPG